MRLELLKFLLMPQSFDREMARARRKEPGLNPTDAAERAEMKGGVAQWSPIERGDKPNATMETLARIPATLECDARDLITAPENPAERTRGN